MSNTNNNTAAPTLTRKQRQAARAFREWVDRLERQVIGGCGYLSERAEAAYTPDELREWLADWDKLQTELRLLTALDPERGARAERCTVDVVCRARTIQTVLLFLQRSAVKQA